MRPSVVGDMEGGWGGGKGWGDSPAGDSPPPGLEISIISLAAQNFLWNSEHSEASNNIFQLILFYNLNKSIQHKVNIN